MADVGGNSRTLTAQERHTRTLKDLVDKVLRTSKRIVADVVLFSNYIHGKKYAFRYIRNVCIFPHSTAHKGLPHNYDFKYNWADIIFKCHCRRNQTVIMLRRNRVKSKPYYLNLW